MSSGLRFWRQTFLYVKDRLSLITHPNALTREQARDLANYARERGIQLIPEIESFGHTRYITRVARYADLLDRDPKGEAFSGLIPVDERSKSLIVDLYREAASIFPSRYLHGGCDEVNWEVRSSPGKR